MESRYFNYDKDYEVVSKWWESWGWPPMPKEFLSKTGIIVSEDGEDLCVAWLYTTDSAVCWAENYLTNKEAAKNNGGIEFLIEELKREANEMGFLIMMSSVSNPSLIKKLLKAGCQEKYDSNMSNLAMVL